MIKPLKLRPGTPRAPRPTAAYVETLETLLHDRGPRVVAITDDTRQRYLGVRTSSGRENGPWLLVQPSLARLGAFREGGCGLRGLLREAGRERWYLADFPRRGRLELTGRDGPVPEEMLPPGP